MDGTSFLQRLLDLGFSHVSFDMARGVSITAWRKSERKTYSVYFAATVADAEVDLLAQVEAALNPPPAPAPATNGFEDLI